MGRFRFEQSGCPNPHLIASYWLVHSHSRDQQLTMTLRIVTMDTLQKDTHCLTIRCYKKINTKNSPLWWHICKRRSFTIRRASSEKRHTFEGSVSSTWSSCLGALGVHDPPTPPFQVSQQGLQLWNELLLDYLDDSQERPGQNHIIIYLYRVEFPIISKYIKIHDNSCMSDHVRPAVELIWTQER